MGKFWGSFNHNNPVMNKIYKCIGGVGKLFTFKISVDITTNDNKLRHSLKDFRYEVLQMTGFRGSRIDPVVNYMGIV